MASLAWSEIHEGAARLVLERVAHYLAVEAGDAHSAVRDEVDGVSWRNINQELIRQKN